MAEQSPDEEGLLAAAASGFVGQGPAATTPAPEPTWPPLGTLDLASATEHVRRVVEAAETAAARLRAQTEARADARIAEADRAADLRVAAAEAEAREIVAEAQAQAQAIQERTAAQDAAARAAAEEAVRGIHEAAARVRQQADDHHTERVRAASDEAETIRRNAREDARQMLLDAAAAVRDVESEGRELSGHLSELSTSLRRNAERLLADVSAAHRHLTARLDAAGPAPADGHRARPVPSAAREPREDPRTPASTGDPAADALLAAAAAGFSDAPAARRRRRATPAADELEVPEFLPRR